MKIDNLTQRRSRAFQGLAQERDKARAQRDELLALLKTIQVFPSTVTPQQIAYAIAKVEADQ